MKEQSKPIDILVLGTGPAALGALQTFSHTDLYVMAVATGVTESLRCQGYLDGKILQEYSEVIAFSNNQDEPEESGEELGLKGYEVSKKPYLLADTQGQLHGCTSVHLAHTDGDLTAWFDGETRYGDQGRVALIQLGDYHVSPYPAEVYNQRYGSDFPLFHDLAINFPTGDSSYSMAAEILHDKRMFLYLLTQLQDHQEQFDLFLMPPILGLSQPLTLLEQLKEGLNIPVAELLSPRNGPAGHRLYQATHRTLQSKQELIETSAVVGFESNPNQVITQVQLGQEAEIQENDATYDPSTLVYNPRVVFLATGGLATGGIVRNIQTGWLEPHFHLPVSYDEAKKGLQTPEENHSLREIGLLVDEKFQPTNRYREICYQNLFASGAILRNPTTKQEANDRPSKPNSILEGIRQGQQAAKAILQILSRSEEA